jgi:Xaa-Pro aminopeptidase
MILAPGGALSQRLAALRQAMRTAGLEAILLTRRPNIFYLTNFSGSAGALVVTSASAALVVDSRYVTAARSLLASPDAPPETSLVAVEESYDQTIAATLASLAVRAAAFESEDLTVARYRWLSDRLAGRLALEPTRGLVERLRERKDAHEVALLRTAAAALRAIARRVGGQLSPGRTERAVAGDIEAAMRSSGFSRPAFDTIVASGPNAALPHATAGDRRLAAGDLVVVDFGGVWDGYCVDMTRTFAVGTPDPEAERVYGAVRDAQRAAIEAVRPGARTGEVDAAARRVLEQAGLGEAFAHGTGHGLGLEVHEDPRVTRARPDAAGDRAPGMVPLETGMVFTVEPGAYLPGWGGVRIEDDVLVTGDGCEILTREPGESCDLVRV